MSDPKNKNKCGRCQYRMWTGEAWGCNYLEIMGHRRPVKFAECTIYLNGRGKTGMMHEQMKELYNAGKNDHEIADELGISAAAVLNWRRLHHLLPNAQRGHQTTIDWVKGRELYDQGMNDRQISEALGCHIKSVEAWRKRNFLPAHCKKKTSGGEVNGEVG